MPARGKFSMTNEFIKTARALERGLIYNHSRGFISTSINLASSVPFSVWKS